MAIEFKLQDPGEGIHEAEIVEVLVSEGDQVEEEQPILVIETDKATTEVPSPVTGVVEKINVKAGDVVEVGDLLIVFSKAGDAEQEEEPRKTGVPPEGEKEAEREKKAEAEEKDRPVPAAPSTRRLARELGVDLHSVPASGPGGRVTPEDVRAFAEKPKKGDELPEEEGAAPRKRLGEKGRTPSRIEAPALPDFGQWGPVERTPLRSIRRATARRMALAWSQIPHVTHQDIADITDLEAFRLKHKNSIQEQGGTLTLTSFALKAAVAALKAHPRFNASLDMESEEIVLKQYYHIGVAVDTDRGLIVPVIRDVDCKSIVELSSELYTLAERTRNGDVNREDMEGGTFTITNVGPLGGTGFTPIINYPQVAILGLGRAALQPVVRGSMDRNEITPRLMIPLVLGFDHRIVDGADAARFMGTVIDVLEDPEQLMITM